MNIWHDIDESRITPDRFISVVEISKGSKNKYELDKETGCIILDRILYTAMRYPANYGFIPKTYADDDDPLDVLVLCQQAIVPLGLVECYPIGIIKMVDDDETDEKIIAIPIKDPRYNEYKDIHELPDHISMEIRHFFEVYKCLEKGTNTVVVEILGAKEAKEAIRISIEKYKEKFSK